MVNELYPFRENFLSLGGHRCHYVDEGSGEPIVMLHGNPTWSFYYRNLINAMKGTNRVIAPDHIGCGLSDKPEETAYSFTLKQRVKDLEQLLEYLEITHDITLVVHDWGGMIGFAYATAHPGSVERLVVLNTAAFHMPKTMNFPLPLWLFRNTPMGEFMVANLNAFCLGAAFFCPARKSLPPEIRRHYLAPYNTVRNRTAVMKFVQDIPLRPGDPSYEMVSRVENSLHLLKKKPMLLCWGEKDFIFNHYFLDEWMMRFPGAEVHRFKDAGHYILEDAGDEIAMLLKRFMQLHPLGR